MNRVIVLLIVAVLSGEAAAAPFEAIASFFSKLFIGGVAKKEVVTAGRIAEKSAAGELDHLSAGEAALRTGTATQAVIEPRPNFALEPVAKRRKDAEVYKTLRTSAEKGDASAMLKMSELTLSGRVSDPGEPYHAYWLSQAARISAQQAAPKLRDECDFNVGKRRTDRWFDSACKSGDGKSMYVSSPDPGGDSSFRNLLLNYTPR